jgi:predicted metal-dependent hydrolase
MQIKLDKYTFELTHITNKKIKKVSLGLRSKDEIIIKTPLKFKSHNLKEIIYDNKEWILKTITKVSPKNRFEFITGGQIPYLGKKYDMKLVEDETIKTVKFIFEEDTFIIKHNSSIKDYETFLEGLKKFYQYNAKKIIDPIFEKYIEITNLNPTKIGYRFAKTLWGSCSSKDSISINYMLLQFDIKCIEYVVLHELCHITHKNHSDKFWSLVSSFMPEYKSIKSQLKSSL